MERIKPYKKYKTSFIDGLDLIPDHWERWKLNRVLFFQEGPGLRTWQFKDEGVKVICVTNITPPIISFKKMTKYISVEEYEEKYKHFTVEKGNILLASSGATWGKVATFDSEEKVILNTSTIRLNTKKDEILTNSIVKHLLNADYVNTQLENLLTGSCQPNFGPTHLNKLYVALPPTSEQTAIANFLDYKTAKIDRFIFKKKQLIKLLNEQKAAIINDAVTKGLNPNTKMKPSGIEWLGDIPEHWEVEGFNKNVYLKHGFQFREEHFSKEGIRVVKITQLSTDGKLRLEKASYVPFHYRESYSNIIIKDGDILMALTGGTIGKIIRADINEEILLQNYRVGNFYPINEKLLRDFLYLQLRSEFIQAQMAFFVRETGQPNIGKGDFRKIKMVVPPTSEQQLIVSHIEKETSIITKTIATIEKEIALVQEYRTALIAEAVTGKIDVRDYNVPSFEEDKEYAEMEEEMGLVAEEEIHLD